MGSRVDVVWKLAVWSLGVSARMMIFVVVIIVVCVCVCVRVMEEKKVLCDESREWVMLMVKGEWK